ncbi:MAG: hypothetical protein QGF00_02145 [Planctomycetota bacterium]|jgi:hypothetical protein|nr:hypothetical protein [Planctomycetota bacterium]MDP7248378.1 hypothetical protein [Planctomycetota bacterium]
MPGRNSLQILLLGTFILSALPGTRAIANMLGNHMELLRGKALRPLVALRQLVVL